MPIVPENPCIHNNHTFTSTARLTGPSRCIIFRAPRHSRSVLVHKLRASFAIFLHISYPVFLCFESYPRRNIRTLKVQHSVLQNLCPALHLLQNHIKTIKHFFKIKAFTGTDHRHKIRFNLPA